MRGWSAKKIGLFLGPTLAVLVLLIGPPEGLTGPAWGVAALLVLMAIWWTTEAIPIPATSLLPILFLPLFGAASAREATAGYASPIIMLLLGGFIIALGIERCGLHKRIALNIVSVLGTGQKTLIFGFMFATALLSMWISNTATTLMMVPIAISAAAALKDDSDRFVTAILLGISYAASIGGVGTPIGTPTNLIAIEWLESNAGATIGFPQWMGFGLPAVALMVPVAWWSVTRNLSQTGDPRSAITAVKEERSKLGPITTPEARAAAVFGVVATLWISRIWTVEGLAALNIVDLRSVGGLGIDMMTAIAGAMAMFIIPAGGGETRKLLSWEEAQSLPWGVLILFGGGISLGQAVTRTGLSAWIGEELSLLSVLPALFFIVIVVALVIFLTELTSNVATMTTLAPILGALSVSIGAAPASLLGPAAVAASCAFMLPVATAPNAIVFATNKIPIHQMMRKGLLVNLAGILIITLIGYFVAPMVL